MARRVTTYEIKGLLSYFTQTEEELPETVTPRVFYCIMKDGHLHLRADSSQTVLTTIKTEGATVSLPKRSVVPGFYGVCVQSEDEPNVTHHFLWKSPDQRDLKFAVLLRAAATGNWPKSKFYDPSREAVLLEVGQRSFFEVPPHEKKLLLLQKLQLCSIRFNFYDKDSNLAEKQIKTETLQELVSVSQHMAELNDCRSFKDFLTMIGMNIFRAMPSITGDVVVDTEDEDIEDPAFEHLAPVYEILHKIYNCSNISDVVRKKSTSVSFLTKLMSVFQSRDNRERELLKQAAHRIYGRLTNRRAAIRKIFNHAFARELYEPLPSYRGVAEVLDILASIINGFASPIKQEHVNMLHRYLIPLHKLPEAHTYFHQQLHYCMILFAQKDRNFCVDIINGILKYWPIGNNPKEQQFLQELEDLFEYVEPPHFKQFHTHFRRRFAQLLQSPHFQATERALWFWRNPSFNEIAVKHPEFGGGLLRSLFEPLQTNTLEHWHESVQTMSKETLDLYKEQLPVVFDECAEIYRKEHNIAADVTFPMEPALPQ